MQLSDKSNKSQGNFPYFFNVLYLNNYFFPNNLSSYFTKACLNNATASSSVP